MVLNRRLCVREMIQLLRRQGSIMASLHNGTLKCESENDLEYEEAVRALNSLQTNTAVLQQLAKQGRRTHEAQARNIHDTAKFLSRCGIELLQLDKLSVIHVAGTKGKGSTCAFCESILREHGFKTGFFSSPHLVAVRERIRINGKPLARHLFARHFWKVYKALDEAKESSDDMPAYFKFLTVMAFSVFLAERVDVAVVEVGIGGEYDCTNVLRSVAAVGITSLGIDHVKILGDTIEQIAWQKAGVMKPGAVAFTAGRQPEAALRVLRERAVERQCPLLVAPPLESYDWGLLSPELGVDSPGQLLNASLALQLTGAWLSSRSARGGARQSGSWSGEWPVAAAAGFPVAQATARGLRDCRWPGRTQVLDRGRVRYFLDGAHTAESMALCAAWFLRSASPSARRVLLFNSTGDRSVADLLAPLLPCAFSCVLLCPNCVTEQVDLSSDQADCLVSREQMLARCRLHQEAWRRLCGGGEVRQYGCVLAALSEIRREQETTQVLVTGSLRLVGAVLSVVDPELASS
ncbi:folylpolyglutamate synthase, mitochondrial [Bacillus rossius redtenbacheri]|uniref:folylpolyglutamate synthase, mitochondrial n=1 Tax=Bacillus rossius redtenbacheri TaxID=93214 RepID=UPI002FDE1892